MINTYNIISGLRDTLNADDTLNTLLGTMPGSPKVILGGSPSLGAQVPVVMIPDGLWTPDPSNLRAGSFQQDINVWVAMLASGQEDVEKACNIAAQIDALLYNKIITTSALRLSGLRLSIAQPTVPVIEPKRAYKTLTYIGFAAQR